MTLSLSPQAARLSQLTFEGDGASQVFGERRKLMYLHGTPVACLRSKAKWEATFDDGQLGGYANKNQNKKIV
ncbi:MAG: hypothetical protein ACI9KK_001599 [Ascidiaceihabitans sp.]